MLIVRRSEVFMLLEKEVSHIGLSVVQIAAQNVVNVFRKAVMWTSVWDNMRLRLTA